MWKAISGYEGYYEVSDDGRVRSLDRVVEVKHGRIKGAFKHLKGKEMKLSESKHKNRNTDGYLVVNLRRDCTSWVAPVHILVANAFIPNPNNLPTVNHIDGNKHNNHKSNLEWASYRDNNIHALAHNLRQPRKNIIRQYTIDGEFIAEYRSASEASRVTGCPLGGISHCINGRTNSSSGYIWKKVSESATTIPKGSTLDDELPVEAQRP